VATDPEQFNCRECVVMERIGALDNENRESWLLHRRLCNRFVNDLQAGGVMLARLTEDMDAETFADRCERLRVIYDTLQPPKAP
jgi:hypothetical protein